MLFRKKAQPDEELLEDEYSGSMTDVLSAEDEYEERPRGSGLIILPILLQLAFAGILFLKSGAAALNYLYALILLLLVTSLVGTYVYNRDGDMKLFAAIAILTSAGVAFQMLADQTYASESTYSLLKLIIGIGGAVLFVLFYRVLRKALDRSITCWSMLAICAFIYLVLMIKGYDPNGYGTTAWISIAGYTLQLTDFTKIAGLFFYASLFSSRMSRSDNQILNMSNLFLFVNVIGSVIIHELGSLFILVFLHLSILYIFMNRGTRKRTYLLVIFLSALFGVGLCFALYKVMLPSANEGTLSGLSAVLWPIVKKVYVRFSITANIQNDPFGAGYQLLQGKKALWTAGLFGNTVNFTAIPLAESDMAFPALVSQFGFVVGLPLIYLFTQIFVSGSEISRTQVYISKADAVVAYGAAVLIYLQALIVILGSCNIIPFTGLPIPFLSRGGTYQAIVLFFCGLLLNMSENDGFGPMKGGEGDESSEEYESSIETPYPFD